MTLAILISAATVLFSAGYILQRQRLDTLELRAGRTRLRGQPLAAKKGRQQ
jgi:hypothetical protein